MDLSTHVPTMGWTRRNLGTILLEAVAEQRARSAARLVQAIKASRKSYETVAHEAGVSTKTISRWANKRHDPSRATVEAVAQALGVDPDWLWQPPPPLGLAVGEDGEVPSSVLAELQGLKQQNAHLQEQVAELRQELREFRRQWNDIALPVIVALGDALDPTLSEALRASGERSAPTATSRGAASGRA